MHFHPSATARRRVRAELELGPNALLAVFVGGEWERKGLRHAVGAIAQRPAWHLAIAGMGDRSAYRALAARAGAEERVHFVGRIDPAGLYAAGDAFVLPTAYETFSLVTHEAAACALPLLVTRVSGPDDLVRPGVHGWFVERDAGAIAGRLAQLEAAPRLRQAMGAAARAAAAPLTWDRVRAAHSRLYRALAPDRSPS